MTPLDPQRLFASIYTDEDVGPHLAPALRRRGHLAQSTEEAANLENSDEAQLTYATSHGMVMLTHNAQDFIPLAQRWYLDDREHAGLILSEQLSQGCITSAW